MCVYLNGAEIWSNFLLILARHFIYNFAFSCFSYFHPHNSGYLNSHLSDNILYLVSFIFTLAIQQMTANI